MIAGTGSLPPAGAGSASPGREVGRPGHAIGWRRHGPPVGFYFGTGSPGGPILYPAPIVYPQRGKGLCPSRPVPSGRARGSAERRRSGFHARGPRPGRGRVSAGPAGRFDQEGE